MTKVIAQISRLTKSDKLQQNFQGLSEHDLTSIVVTPVLKSIGYQHVIYHGGPDERGKDIICWGVDELGDRYAAVAQVKRYRPSRKAKDTKSFSEIVTQLSQPIEESVPHSDGVAYRPKVVYFITPYPLDTRTLQSRFEGFRAISHRVTIIDGTKLATLTLQNLPAVASRLLGADFEIESALVKQLNNQALLSALQYDQLRDLRQIYVDIDFFLGRVSTRLFCLSTSQVSVAQNALDREGWASLKESITLCSRELGIQLLPEPMDAVEKDFERQQQRVVRWKQTLEGIESDLRDARNTKAELENELSSTRKQLLERDPKLRTASKELQAVHDRLGKIGRERVRREERQLAQREGRVSSITLMPEAEYEALVSTEPEMKSAARELESKIRAMERSLNSIRIRLDEVTDTVALVDRKKQSLVARRPVPRFNVTVDGSRLANVLSEKGEVIKETIRRFNRKTPPKGDLRKFLSDCEHLLSVTNAILKNPIIASSVGMVPDQVFHRQLTAIRLTIPIQLVFETGLNLAVLGEAGAGKTTSLQMYAWRKIEEGDTGNLAIFAPLGRLVRAWAKENERLDRSSSISGLEAGIAAYLSELGVTVTTTELASSFRSNGGVLLLDGVDEAIRNLSWIPQAIQSIATRYPKLQLITSSRMSGPYLDDIPFLGITLLPFTEKQRRLFVKHWFGENAKDKIEKVETHVERSSQVALVVRNPLLTTILCVLADNEVPLPDGEIRLYEERMRLLMGYYDVYKGVSRVRSSRHVLEAVARKIAFWLHSGHRREEDREALYRFGERCSRLVTPRAARLAVDELVDPCNVLVPMSDDGKLGFGHLRYQEYLAALEMVNNRNVDVVEYVDQEWWRGVLVFFAQMSDSLDWLLAKAIEAMSVGKLYDGLIAMVEAGPKGKRSEHRAVIEMHRKLDMRIPPTASAAEEIDREIVEEYELER